MKLSKDPIIFISKYDIKPGIDKPHIHKTAAGKKRYDWNAFTHPIIARKQECFLLLYMYNHPPFERHG